MRRSRPANLPGPGRIATLRALLPVPFRRFPDFLRAITARYGNLVAFSLPWRSYVFINEPALVKDILVTQQHAFSKSLGTRVLRLLLGEGLLTSEDPLHLRMRRLVQPAFHRDRIAQYAQIMERDARVFAQGVRTGASFDVHAAMMQLTLQIATETLFGSDESDSAQLVADARQMITRRRQVPALQFLTQDVRKRVIVKPSRLKKFGDLALTRCVFAC